MVYKPQTSSIANDAREGAAQIRDTAKDTVHDMRDTAERLGARARSVFYSAKDEFSHGVENVTDQIRQRPVQSTLIALGAGLILGALFRR